MKDFKKRLSLLFAVAFGPHSLSAQESPWSFRLLAGPAMSGQLQDVVKIDSPQVSSELLLSTSISRRMTAPGLLELHAELVGGKHIDSSGAYEGGGLVVVRITEMPWQRFVESQFSIGNGLSVLNQISVPEQKESLERSKILYFVTLEFAFDVWRDWSWITRIHHRSGVFGVFTEEKNAGSNFILAGLKLRL